MIVCETKAADDAERALVTERVRRLVQDVHDVTVQDVKLVAPGAIPKTSSGKRQRSRCRELYLHGGLDVKRSSALSHVLVAVRGAAGLATTRVRRFLRRD